MSRHHSQRKPAWAGPFLPKVEVLENRLVPSCTVLLNGAPTAGGALPAGGVVTVIGNGGNNDVDIEDNGTQIEIECDGRETQFDGATDVTIAVRTLGGDDDVDYNRSGDLLGTRNIRVNLGSGEDNFEANIDGDVLAGSTLDLIARANGSDDEAVVDASDVDVDGFFLTRLRLFNEAEVEFSGDLHGTAGVIAVGSESEDDLSVDIDLEEDSPGTLVAFVSGLGDDDELELTVDLSEFATTDVTAAINGGSGDDDCEATDNVGVVNCEDVDDDDDD